MNKVFLLLMGLLMSAFTGQAQGLSGKTFILAPHVSLAPNTGDLTRGGDLLFHPSLDIDLEKVLNRSNSWGLVLSGSYTRIEPVINFQVSEGNLSGGGLGAFYKRYLSKRGAIAPLGTWFKFTGMLHLYSAVSSDLNQTYDLSGINSWSLRLAWGAHWRFNSKMMLLVAVEGKAERFDYFFGFGSTPRVISHSEYRVASSYLNLKLGLVFPLF